MEKIFWIINAHNIAALVYRIDSRDGIEYIIYALAPPVSVNRFGIILIFLAIVGLLINRKLKFAQMSFLWAMFTFFILFVIGWYAPQNAMFLGSLYFGWAFFVLVFH